MMQSSSMNTFATIRPKNIHLPSPKVYPVEYSHTPSQIGNTLQISTWNDIEIHSAINLPSKIAQIESEFQPANTLPNTNVLNETQENPGSIRSSSLAWDDIKFQSTSNSFLKSVWDEYEQQPSGVHHNLKSAQENKKPKRMRSSSSKALNSFNKSTSAFLDDESLKIKTIERRLVIGLCLLIWFLLIALIIGTTLGILLTSPTTTTTTTTTSTSSTTVTTTTTTATSTTTTTSSTSTTSTTTTTSTTSTTTTSTTSTTSTATTTTTTTSTTSTSTTTTSTTTTTTSTPPNLLVNPGAETSGLAGWAQTGPSTVLQDTGGSLYSGYNQYAGVACFAGGSGSGGASSGLTQNINLINGPQNFSTAQLDSGTLSAEVSFYYQNWYSLFFPYDDLQVTIAFLSVSNTVLVTQTIIPSHCTLGQGWCYYSNIYALPSGTRSIDYTMTFSRNSGTRIGIYTDDNSFRVI